MAHNRQPHKPQTPVKPMHTTTQNRPHVIHWHGPYAATNAPANTTTIYATSRAAAIAAFRAVGNPYRNATILRVTTH